MVPFTVMLKNYRCFEDSAPLRLEVRPGFTALVGPNNSGKSSFLRFFHEMRSLLLNLRGEGNLRELARGNVIPIQHQGVEDSLELFHDRNNRPLTIELEFPVQHAAQISKIRLFATRDQPSDCRGELYADFSQSRLVNLIQPVDPQKLWTRFQTASGEMTVDLSPLHDMFDSFERSFYIGAFRNAISEGAGSYFDLAIGTSFIATWDNWKTGSSRQTNLAAQQVADDLAHIFGYKNLEINAANGQRTMQIIVDSKPYRLRELGSGFAQFLVVFGNLAIRRPSFVLIDEPELNLHPSLQADFLTSLASYSTYGTMFATHSVGLARTMADRIYTFHRNGYASTATTFEQTPNYAEFVGEMSFSAFKEMGHETILLVEGVSDVKAAQQFLRALGKDHTVVVIPLGGAQLIRGGVQAELAELGRLSNNVAVLIDSERRQAGDPLAPERAAFVTDCQGLRFKVHVTDRRAFENYLSEAAVRQVKGSNYHALGDYQGLDSIQPSWAKSENWRIARAMTKQEILANDLGRFLDSLP